MQNERRRRRWPGEDGRRETEDEEEAEEEEIEGVERGERERVEVTLAEWMEESVVVGNIVA